MAARLIIDWDPLPEPPNVAEPTEQATWASLSISVEIVPEEVVVLTQVFDPVARTIRSTVDGPLMPLVEWIARSWVHLAHGPTLAFEPGRRTYRWERTRRLRYVGEGAALPDLWLLPYGDDYLRLVWRRDSPDRSAYERVLFQREGEAIIRRQDALDALEGLLVSVLDRLRSEALADDWRLRRLEAYWELARSDQDRDARAARIGALAGVLWWDTSSAVRDRLAALADTPLDPVTRALLPRVNTEEELGEIVEIARGLRETCDQSAPAPDRWQRLSAGLSAYREAFRSLAPWERGWAAAGALRRELGVPEDAERVSLSDALGFTPVSALVSGRRGDSLVAWTGGHLLIRARPSGDQPHGSRERFLTLRDYFPPLFESTPEASHARFLVEGSTGSNPEANAFAAELLAPVIGLRRRLLGVVRVTEEDLVDLANELEAPYGCVRHQVYNHHLAEIDMAW